MELNWSTFFLEIINFLVLVWILKRFLYKPVLDVIARRRAGIESILAEAKEKEAAAEALKEQYEGRLADWDKERQEARERLTDVLDQERARQQEALDTKLAQQREKARVNEARRLDDIKRKMAETALAQGAHFASRILEQAVGAETETRLIDLVITELSNLPADRIAALRNNWATLPDAITVATAYAVADDQQRRLKQVLKTISGVDLPLHFELDRSLVAGINIVLGAWVLGTNIRDELKGFAELVHDEH